uniref:Uncharacterized protein n=2 Tax=Avena sativa TaxID=4498 RepID=A0ACD6A325_AVESA
MEAPHRAPAAGETPPAAAAESSSSSSTEESRWLASLSEPELDFLISLKMLAVKRAETAGRPHLADAFDLRTLRALGVVLLESLKERLKGTAVDPTILDRLALSRDPDADADANVSVSGSDSEVFRPRSKDQPKPSGIKRKQKKMQAGFKSKKRRKLSESR